MQIKNYDYYLFKKYHKALKEIGRKTGWLGILGFEECHRTTFFDGFLASNIPDWLQERPVTWKWNKPNQNFSTQKKSEQFNKTINSSKINALLYQNTTHTHNVPSFYLQWQWPSGEVRLNTLTRLHWCSPAQSAKVALQKS